MGGAQAKTHDPELLRHRKDRLFGGTDDDRKGHQAQGQRTGDDGGAQVEKQDKDAEAKETVDDGRNSGQIDDGQVNGARQPIVSRVLGQINSRRDRGADNRLSGEVFQHLIPA